ncbi:MAG: hypothetical protein ACPGOV_00240 [Magnetovibrionaceae bacterium]
MTNRQLPLSASRPLSRMTACFVILLGCVLGLALSQPAHAEGESGIEPFFGTFSGHAIVGAVDGLSGRDLEVEISPAAKGGFRLTWLAITRRIDGRLKRKAYTITFRPSGRDDIYASAMRKDSFGNWMPLDPLKGDPFVWATINDRTLTVNALIITDEGSYEMQTYDRTLRDDGNMDLRFARIRDGEAMKEILATLTREEG